MTQTSGRRLAAVLALDVVGYSQMMGADEARTLDRLLRRRKGIFDPLVAAHRGRVIKGTGDGILAEFASARDALHAALRIQHGLTKANADDVNDQPMLARVGINTGDIIFKDGDIYGDGVNIAARLEASAPTGGICVSGNALDEVRRLGIPYKDAGPLNLKNISLPIPAYHIAADVIATVNGTMVAPDSGVGRGRPQHVGLSKTRPPLIRLWGEKGSASFIVGAGLLILSAITGAWWWLRPSAADAHSMSVRLAGFQLLSSDLPKTIAGVVDAEIAAAFSADGVVGVSTAPAPPPGSAPAYALGGTIQRDGQSIRVITRLTNERSGATLWGSTLNYDGDVAKVPHHIAVDAGNVVRCGLFGASTYREPLSDIVLRDYMQFCQAHWDPNTAEGRKALLPAQRVVAAVPDFSWGWAGVAAAYWKIAGSAYNDQAAEEARALGRQAADRAIAIDARNSEALYIKSMVVDRRDWIARETLLKRAIAARRLDCGCEFHQYGWMLMNVGRTANAVEQLRQANDMLALYVYTPLNLAEGLVAAGKIEEAKTLFKAAANLAPNSAFAARISLIEATMIGDAKALRNPALPLSVELRAALLRGYQAVASGNAGEKADAVKILMTLPEDQQTEAVTGLLADLGASHDAFIVASRVAAREYPGPSIFWYQNMRATLNDPGFTLVAERLGLIKYWRTTHSKPDACNEKSPPPFCRMV